MKSTAPARRRGLLLHTPLLPATTIHLLSPDVKFAIRHRSIGVAFVKEY